MRRSREKTRGLGGGGAALVITLTVLLFTLMVTLPARADSVFSDKNVTVEDVEAVLNKYDKDGLYIIRHSGLSDEGILSWFGTGTLAQGIDTCVHESTHGFSHNRVNTDCMAIYTGNSKYIVVPYTEVFPSSQMAVAVPLVYRTFRYDTYIGANASNVSANTLGVYGLLNEFAAYCWGMNTSMSLLPYYQEHAETKADWHSYWNECANDMVAFAEFKYYTLHYLYFAQTNQVNVYEAVMANHEFLRAFAQINAKFEKLIAAYTKIRDQYGSGQVYLDGAMVLNAYNTLIPEIYSEKYDAIRKALETGNPSGAVIEPVITGNDLTLKVAARVYYTGKARKPEVTVSFKGKKLSRNYYTIRYENNVNAGIAMVTATGKNKYKGKKGSTTFLIDLQKPVVSSVSRNGDTVIVSLKRNKLMAQGSSGYELQYSTDPAFISGTMQGKVDNAAEKISIGTMTAGKTYYIRLRYMNATYRSSWSSVWKIML